jgi:hypothetical protein
MCAMPTSDVDKPPICCAPPTALAEALVVPSATAAKAGSGAWHHWVFLLMASAVVTAACALSIRGEEEVVLPIVNVSLPGTCTFRRLTNLPCPGCGMTRSFISMGHGRVVDAWKFNPAGIVFFGVVAFQIPYRIFQIVRLRRGLPEHSFARFDSWVLVGVVVVLLGHWVYALAVRLW